MKDIKQPELPAHSALVLRQRWEGSVFYSHHEKAWFAAQMHAHAAAHGETCYAAGVEEQAGLVKKLQAQVDALLSLQEIQKAREGREERREQSLAQPAQYTTEHQGVIMQYRKKPVVIEAVVWNGENEKEVMDFMGWRNASCNKKDGLRIHTLEGTLHASIGDYIIKGVKGEFYACKPDIFAQTYENADVAQQPAQAAVPEGWKLVKVNHYSPRMHMAAENAYREINVSAWGKLRAAVLAAINAAPVSEGEGV